MPAEKEAVAEPIPRKRRRMDEMRHLLPSSSGILRCRGDGYFMFLGFAPLDFHRQPLCPGSI